MGEWRRVQLGELAEIFDGPHATPKKVASGPLFLGISNLAQGRLDLSETEHLSEDDFARWTRRVTPRTGDVVFSYETRLGEAALIPSGLRVCLGRRMGLLRAHDGVDARFLLYAYLGPAFQGTLRQRTVHGSTVDRIPLIEMGSFPIEVPDLSTQRAIAHILGTLDDKIELNRRMNETLEAMARALFKSWFVDFDPICAKAEGRTPAGMDAETAKLFPSEFVESELGAIPKGWTAVPVYDIATYVNGAAYKAFQPNDERRGLPIIKIAELKAGVTAQTRFSDVAMPEKYRLRTGDILFSWSGNPDTSIDTFVWAHGEAWLNQHIFRVDLRCPGDRSFVLATFKYLRPVFAEIARNKQTTGLGHVTAGDMQRLLVVKPDARVLAAWDRAAALIFAKGFRAELESLSLANLRDELLPRLLSGELSVEVAERDVEAVA